MSPKVAVWKFQSPSDTSQERVYAKISLEDDMINCVKMVANCYLCKK